MITAAALEKLMYDIPLLVTATRGRRRLTLHTTARGIGVAVSTLYRVESACSCDINTLIRILRWLENN